MDIVFSVVPYRRPFEIKKQRSRQYSQTSVKGMNLAQINPDFSLQRSRLPKRLTPFGIIHHRRGKHRIVVCRAGGVWLNLFEGYQYSSSLKKLIHVDYQVYYEILNEICANKPHRPRRAGAIGGKTRQTNCVGKLIAMTDKIVIMLITIKYLSYQTLKNAIIILTLIFHFAFAKKVRTDSFLVV